MIKPIALAVFVMLSSCTDHGQHKQVKKGENYKSYRFYDFNLRIDIVNPFKGVESRYLYVNSGMDYYDHENNSVLSLEKFKPNTLYYTNVFENLNSNAKVKDTLKITITNSQIDTLYHLASDLFKIDTNNVSKDSIPRPPMYTDGLAAIVELDLGFRGNRYQAELPFGSENEESSFAKLYKYVLKLKSATNMKF